MNIFWLDNDPAEAARAHCDRHVVKMIVETAQLLSAAWHTVAPDQVELSIGSTDPTFPMHDFANDLAAKLTFGYCYYINNQRIYAPTHLHHPAVHWVVESRANYDWLWRLGMFLLEEYTYRYKKEHATRYILRTLELTPLALPDDALSDPPLMMPDEHQVVDADGYGDAVASYRRYYRDGKRHLLQYTRRQPPDWLRDVATFKPSPEQKKTPL